MSKRPDPEMVDADNPEWTAEDFARAKTLSELPLEEQRILKGIMALGKQQKKKISIHLSADLLEQLKSTGDGWELRIEEAVRQWLARQNKRRKIAS